MHTFLTVGASFLLPSKALDTVHCTWVSQVALVVKNAPVNAGDIKRPGFHPWVGKIPWRRAWQSTPVFLPGEFHGQRSVAGYSHGVAKSWTRLKRLSPHAQALGLGGFGSCSSWALERRLNSSWALGLSCSASRGIFLN